MSTKTHIIDTAAHIFSRDGYYKATMDDIAKEANLAKGSLYYHFKSKEELFVTIIESGVSYATEKIEEYASEDLPLNEITMKCVNFIIDYQLEYPALFSLFYSENTNGMSESVVISIRNMKSGMYSVLSKIFREANEMGLVGKMDYDLASVAILSMVNGICQELVYNNNESNIESAKMLIVSALFNGILKSRR